MGRCEGQVPQEFRKSLDHDGKRRGEDFADFDSLYAMFNFEILYDKFQVKVV